MSVGGSEIVGARVYIVCKDTIFVPLHVAVRVNPILGKFRLQYMFIGDTTL